MNLNPRAQNPPAVDPRSDWIAAAGLTVLWVIPLLAIGAHGNFPLNDDWAYGRAVRALLETGLIERVSWTWTPVITHTGLGAAFSSVAGFSFESLRWSSLFMGWVGLLGSYALARQAGVSPLASTFVAAVVGLNPVYLNLSYTFMTDISFTATCVWGLFFMTRGLARNSVGLLAVGILFALLATLSRQAAIALPIALAVVLVISAPTRARSWMLGIAGIAVVVAGYQGMLQIAYGPMDSGRIFSPKNYVAVGVDSYPLFSILKNGVNTLVYLGAFLAPVAVIAFFRLTGRAFALTAAAAGIVTAGGLGLIAKLDLTMPPGMNVIYNLGLGPTTVHAESARRASPEAIWWVLCGIGIFSAVVAIASVVVGAWPRMKMLRERPDWLILLVCPAIYLGPHLIRSPYFDRYLLPMLAPLLIGLFVFPDWSQDARKGAVAVGVGVFLLFGVYGILGTRDYMERHRAGWGLMNEQMDAGVDVLSLDGGFEFRGWYQFLPHWRGDRYIWRYGGDDEFRLSYDESCEGYEVIATRDFHQWMPWQTETLRVFQRLENPPESASNAPKPDLLTGTAPHR